KDKFVWIFPLLQPTGAGFIIVRTNPNPVVLQASINIIVFFVIYIYSVKLPNCRSIVFYPSLSIIITNIDAAIVAINQMAGHFWGYTKGVVVCMHVICIYAFEGFSTVGRF